MAVLVNEIGGIEYDAVLESELNAEIKKTGYAIESGANVTDHTMPQPIRYSARAAVSNIELGFSAVGLAAGALSNLTNSGIGALVAGASSLAIDKEDRASSTMVKLMDLFAQRKLYTVNTGQITLKNMMLVSFRQVNEPRYGGMVVIDLELEELLTTELIATKAAAPTQDDLHDNDDSKTEATSFLDKGIKTVDDIGSQVSEELGGLAKKLGGLF